MADVLFQPVLVTSPPLKNQARQLLRHHCPDGTLLVWQHGAPAAERQALRERLLGRSWSLCISFYNDYIFSREEINAFDCIVNIHPALPGLRGRGYDILPLIDCHASYGATLHFVNEAIDAGEIIDVISRPIPRLIRYPQFRALTQQLSLRMLERLLQRCRQSGIAQVAGELQRLARVSEQRWSGACLSSGQLEAILAELRCRQPDHPVLQDLPPPLQVALAS